MNLKDLKKLKEDKDIVILAHYYVDGKIQELADYIGDSFYLAQMATKLENEKIVLAGVYFMGESVKILNPNKKVYLVDKKADCPMAHMVTVEKIEEMRKEYNDLAVVCYINSTAEIKAHSDICVTSSNAVKIVKKLKEKNIFFIPDGNLGRYISKFVPNKNIISNDGCCPVHNNITRDNIVEMKEKYKEAFVLVHPECNTGVLEMADYIGSTSGIIEMVGEFKGDDFIIVTEKGIEFKLKGKYPSKNFYFIENMICEDMKYSTEEKLIDVIKNDINEVFVDENIIERAEVPLKRMLELGV